MRKVLSKKKNTAPCSRSSKIFEFTGISKTSKHLPAPLIYADIPGLTSPTNSRYVR